MAGADTLPDTHPTHEAYQPSPEHHARSVTKAAGKAVTKVDIFMLVLALFSVGLLLWEWITRPSAEIAHQVFLIDAGVCAIFAIEFLARWRRDGWHLGFLGRNWYEILGMIPISHPALRSLRLLRVIVLVIRLVRAMDRAFGEQFTYRMAERFSRPIVQAIKKPITVAVLDEVVAVLETGNFPENLSASLAANQGELRAIVAEKLAEDRITGKMKFVPFHDEITESVIDTAFRVVLAVLADDRIDEFFAHVVAENRAQIRLAVQQGLVAK